MHILTTRADLTPAEIRHRMGSRWRQENHYRYARIHFDLDSHDGYRTTGDDPDRMVPNPAKKTAYAQVEKARRALHSAETTSDAALLAAHSPQSGTSVVLTNQMINTINTDVHDAEHALDAALDAHQAIPARLPLSQVNPGHKSSAQTHCSATPSASPPTTPPIPARHHQRHRLHPRRRTQSMGRTGSALDNAVAEAFNSTLEWELLRNNHFQTREQPRHNVTPGLTTTTANGGIPPTACSAPSTTNTPALRDAPTNRPTNTTGDERHEPRSRRLRRRCHARRAPRQATGPSLRPQASLPRSLRDRPPARP